MNKYEKVAMYYLGVWHLICAADGWGYILFGFELTGPPGNFFLEVLRDTSWFWLLLKVLQTIGCASLLLNYRPAFGFTILVPITVVIVLFYVFELPELIPFGVPLVAACIVLFRAFRQHYVSLIEKH